ncbi:MAG: AAA family ATPase [Candidatus Eremiobacteraeota bacterium]|nr:AAA family ATPase [Candidatus Eremiobacteraeota bacterium]
MRDKSALRMAGHAIGGTRFIGRTAELDVLSERRRDVVRSRGGFVLVSGPAGIGKSRLLHEFAEPLRRGRTPLVVRTECLAAGGATFEPIRDLVYAVADTAALTVDAAAHAALDRGTFFRSLESTLHRLSERRTIVFCVEDLHWADAATLEFLAFISDRIARSRLLIGGTYRDDEIATTVPFAAAISHIGRAPSTRRIVLGPLPDGDVHAILGDTLEAVAAADRFEPKQLREIVARAEGNPLYAEELLRGLVEGSDSHADTTIGALTNERLERLDPVARDVIAIAAVIGYRFDVARLQTLVGSDPEELARVLRAAHRCHLIVEERDTPSTFRFRHALVHEAINARVLAIERRPLHARIARELEALPNAERPIDEIAYHWWNAGDGERALPANEAAGDRAMAVYAYADAAKFYERALSFTSDSDRASGLCVRIAGALSIAGDHEASLDFYERALAYELAVGRYNKATDIVRRIAGRLVYAGREVEARKRLSTFLREQDEHLSDVESLLVEGWPILMDLGGGGVRSWRERLLATDGRARAGGSDVWSLLLLETNAHAAVGDIERLHESLDLLDARARAGEAIDRAHSLLTRALTATYTGYDPGAPAAAIASTRDFCRSHGLHSVHKYIDAVEAFERYLYGDVRGAANAAHRALEDSQDTNQRSNLAIVAPYIGLDCGDRQLVSLASDDALVAAFESGIESNRVALAAGAAAACRIALGRMDDAAALLERALEGLQTSYAAQFMLPLAARHIRSSRAHARLEEIVGSARPGDSGAAATAAMVRAILLSRDGAPDARRAAEESVRRYEALGWPLLQAQAFELSGDPAAARALLQRCGVRGPRVSRLTSRSPLSEREREIGRAVAAGLGNREIALALGVSVKTVETHLTRTFARMGFRSRAQLAAFVTDGANAQASGDTSPPATPRP